MPASRVLSAGFLAVLAAFARAGVDVEIRNGDQVAGTISPATEVEIVRFRAPAGASLSVKAAAAKKGPQVHVQLKDPAGLPLASAEGRSASIKGLKAPVSGLYSVEVTSKDGASVGDYTLAVKWKSRTTFGESLAVPAAGTKDLSYSADAGATATFTVKAAKKSAAAPTLAGWTAPDASVEALSGTSQKRPIDSTGDGKLTVASAAGGDVVANARIKPPKASRHKYALTSETIGAGASGDTAYSSLVGAGGGSFAVPIVAPGSAGAQLDGAAVRVPAGALPVDTAIVIATAPDILPPVNQVAAGAAVSFGPEGLRFDSVDPAKSATVTIPFSAAFASVKDQVVILTRDAKGEVSTVAKPYTFDEVAGTVSFEMRHFSAFRAFAPVPPPQAAAFDTAAAIADPQDLCAAFDPDGSSTAPIYVFVAEGNTATVGALRLPDGTTEFTHETWVGGGSQTVTPVYRTDFRFVDHVNTVYATSDGTLYVGTNALIFRVDATTGMVERIAGAGPLGDEGDGGPALQATFKSIRKIVVDAAGGIYVADDGALRIRFIDTQGTGNVTAWAGDGRRGFGADGGDLATTAFQGPSGLSFAPTGGLYVADGARVRRIDPAGPVNVTVAGRAGLGTSSIGDGGPPTAARFKVLRAIAPFVDPLRPNDDALLVADSFDHTLRLVDFTIADVSLIAGTHGSAGFSGDAGSTPGLMNGPNAVATSRGLVFVSDRGNGRVRVISGP